MQTAPLFNPENNLISTKSGAVKNDYLKFLYSGMLLQLPLHEVREFWDVHCHPYAGSPPDYALFYNWLWQDDGFSDINYLVNILCSIEQFLNLKGFEAKTFLNNALRTLNCGLPVPLKTMFKICSPFLHSLFTSNDLRYTILELIENYTSFLFPGISQRLIRHITNNETDWSNAIIMVARKSPDKQLSSHDLSFEPILPFDCELWTATIVRHIPLCFYLPPFEKLAIFADSRPACQIVPDLKYHDNAFYHHSRKIGIETDFQTFLLSKKLLTIPHLNQIPTWKVVEVISDYFCPVRKRVVLQKGCVYGAPVALYSLQYLKAIKKPDDFLSGLVDSTTSNESMPWLEITRKHEALINLIKPEIFCIYNRKNESISVNNRHLLKMVPAKILRYILSRFCSVGQTEFEYHELYQQPDLIFDKYAPNISIRIKRLSKILDLKIPQVSIHPTGRGKFSLTITCKIHFTEN